MLAHQKVNHTYIKHTHTGAYLHKEKPKMDRQLIEFGKTKGEGRTERSIVRIRGGRGEVKPKSIQMEWS